MPGYIPPPYEELAEDGQRYFKILGTPPALVTTYEYLLEAAELAAKLPEFKAQGIEIDLLLRQIQNEVAGAARGTARLSVAFIRARIEATRVRPKGDNRLSASVLSKPVPGPIGLSGGSVGIGDIEALSAGTLRPSGGSKIPFYWRAQEFGSDHLVKLFGPDGPRTLVGVFQPGDAAPDGAQFRTHPNFEVRSKGTRHRMVIRNPISERGYLREGAMEAAEFRRAEFKSIESRAIDKMRAIATGSGL